MIAHRWTDSAPRFGPHTHLISLLLSLTLHMVVLFGLGFSWQTGRARQPPPMIEVTLIQGSKKAPPQEFNHLAQANQNGSGKTKHNLKPPKQRSVHESPPPVAPIKSVQAKAPSLPSSRDTQPEHTQPSPTVVHRPDLADILASARRVATSSEFSGVVARASALHSSKRFIDARTYAPAAAAYLKQWVEKVERIGNLNYPRAAKENNLSGRLILEVTLRPDGSVYSTRVLAPSPIDILNQAAKRIVSLAAPYAKVPGAVLQGRDLLVITRSWEFDDGSQFSPH